MNDIDKRIGKFSITQDLIKENPEAVIELFCSLKAIVIRAECLFHLNAIEYIAISKKFKKLKYGSKIPNYVLELTQNKEGKITSISVE